MTNHFTRRTYFRETVSFDETPTKEQMQSLVNEGFRLDRRNLIWQRSAGTSQRHPAIELDTVLGADVAKTVEATIAA
jgi:hypothetical protein